MLPYRLLDRPDREVLVDDALGELLLEHSVGCREQRARSDDQAEEERSRITHEECGGTAGPVVER